MAFEQQVRRRGSSATAASSSLDAMLASSSSTAVTHDKIASTTATEQPQARSSRSSLEGRPTESELESVSMSPRSATNDTRSARSTSSASRNSNRLSLTLPIAPPNSIPSRPIPTPSSSVPPTPLETSAVASPTDPNEFIVAIAAQERRVLELREELSLAELELRRLKKQFTAAEGYKKRASARNNDLSRAMQSPTLQQSEHSPTTQRSSELERRKAILLAQSQGTPRENKRTIIRGGHTRTLSLLSPTRPNGEFPPLEDNNNDAAAAAAAARQSVDSFARPDWKPRSATINKRATWAPRQTQPPNGVKQIANDFKQGLWTFVEDLRQATVGDEAISGKFSRTSDMAPRLNKGNGDQETIRASSSANANNNRGRIPFPTETSSETSTPVKSNFSSGSFNERFHQQQQQKNGSMTSKAAEPAAPAAAVTKARKHFSWTPLTFDQIDDDDWSNWDTPTGKQSRWSGSTVNGDIIPAPVSDRSDENEGTLRRKRSISELRSASQSPTPAATNGTTNNSSGSSSSSNSSGNSSSTKLEELPQVILNRLSPGNIKRTAADFMREWEKSLSPPPERETETETETVINMNAGTIFGDVAHDHLAATR